MESLPRAYRIASDRPKVLIEYEFLNLSNKSFLLDLIRNKNLRPKRSLELAQFSLIYHKNDHGIRIYDRATGGFALGSPMALPVAKLRLGAI